jgi:hypothetical protein
MLLLHELLAWCSSSCCVVEYNVMFTFLHTQKKKKKKICTCYVRLDVVTKREVYVTSRSVIFQGALSKELIL